MKTFRVAIIYSFIILLLTLTLSCESENDDFIALSKEIRLSAIEKDGTVELKWTLSKVDNFREYRVYRTKDKSAYYQNTQIYRGTDFFEHTFVDENPNTLGMNYYWVEALGGNDYDYSNIYKSNMDSVQIGNYASFSFFPKSVIINKEENLLGFIDGRQKFTLFNFEEEKTIGTLDVMYSFRYPCFGTFNGQTELYIGDNSSNSIAVYDTKAFKPKANIPLSIQNIYSLATNGSGKIYVSSDYDSYIEVANRDFSGSNLVNSSYDKMYLNYSESQDVLIANEDDSYSNLYVYNVDSNGNITYNGYTSSYLQGYNYACVKEDPANGHIYIQPYGLMNIPGSRTVTSSAFGSCQDIAFTSSFVYTAPFSSKAIYKYDRNGNFIESLVLPGYPVYVFVDNDRLVVLFVEQQIPLSQVSSNPNFKGYNQETAFGICFLNL